MFTKNELQQQRERIENLRQQLSVSPSHAQQLGQSIASSWQRSVTAEIPQDRVAAPLLESRTQHTPTALEIAISHCAQDLRHIAEQSSMVVAIGDVGSTII